MTYSSEDGKNWKLVNAVVPVNRLPAIVRWPPISKKNTILSLLCAVALALNFLIAPSSQGINTSYNMAVTPLNFDEVTQDSPELFSFTEEATHPIAHSTTHSAFKEWMWYLKAREGFIPTEYRCPAGILTIGYGHNVEAWGHTDETADGECTYKEASKVLYSDIQAQFNQVMKLLPHLNKNQALAVTSLAANCGINKIIYTSGNPKKGYSAFWKAVKAGKTPNFSVYTRYRTPKGKVVQSPNLISARNFEQMMFEGKGEKPILTGFTKQKKPVYKMMDLEKAGQFFREVLIKRDIVPAQVAGNY